LDWFRETLVAEGTISESDLDLMQALDNPDEVVDAIFSHYANRGFEPSAEERAILLEL
jgi:predicted Rossmann-fold nucleotide-binding protein